MILYSLFRVILRLYSLGTRYEIEHTVEMSNLPVLHTLTNRGVCVQMKPMMKPHEMNPFANQLAGKLQSFIRLHLAITIK